MLSCAEFRLVLLWHINFWWSVTGQQCPSGPAKLIQATYLWQYDIGTCTGTRDYAEHLTAFLDDCTCALMADVTGEGACQYECLYGNGGCRAMTHSLTDGCQICQAATTPGAGNGNNFRRDDVFVAGWMLRAYIDGWLLDFSVGILFLPSRCSIRTFTCVLASFYCVHWKQVGRACCVKCIFLFNATARLSPCLSNPCAHGSTCRYEACVMTCECATYRAGPLCETGRITLR